jgi:hypothetical protein
MQKAAELLGGRKKLARYLLAPAADLDKWIAGEAKPPLAIFLRAVDLIIDETTPSGDSSDPGSSEPRDCSSAGASHQRD